MGRIQILDEAMTVLPDRASRSADGVTNGAVRSHSLTTMNRTVACWTIAKSTKSDAGTEPTKALVSVSTTEKNTTASVVKSTETTGVKIDEIVHVTTIRIATKTVDGNGTNSRVTITGARAVAETTVTRYNDRIG